jgi:membrane-associated phospholipid phosphatase
MDARIAVWVATHRVATLDDLFVALGTVEKLGLVWVLAAIAIGWARRCGLWGTATLAATVALATLAADSVSFAVKDLTNRQRPFEAHPQIHPLYVVHSSSFPAGHAATAFAGAVVLAYVAPRAAPLLGVIAGLIGASRVYVGVHYPTDVLAGAAIGIAVGAVAVLLLRTLRARGFRPVALALAPS